MTTARPGADGATRPADDPAASMALLTSVLRGAQLDYGRGARPDRERPGPLRLVGLAMTLVLVGLVLAAALVQRRHDAPAVAAAKQSLVTRVQARTEALAAQQRALDELQSRIAAQEEAALRRTAAGAALAAGLDRLELAAGQQPLVGPGLTVVLDDAQTDPATGTPPDGGRVLDQDLQVVVNGLWQAGAEAIAVNGERLTSTSAIRTAGEAILVDLRPLVPPYSIDAIGDPARLPQEFDRSAAGAELRLLASDYGIRWHATPGAELSLPAGPGPAGQPREGGERS